MTATTMAGACGVTVILVTPPEREFKDKNICATGLIKVYRGTPEIIVNDPKMIR